MTDENYINLQCTHAEMAELAYDAAYLVRVALDSQPMDAETMAKTIMTAITTAMHARDPSSTRHEQALGFVEAARKMHRALRKSDA